MAFTSSITAETVIGFLTTTFSRYGNHECIVTDNGPQLTSTMLSTFMKECNIMQIKVYHPASNGAVERFNQVPRSCVQAAIIQAVPWKQMVTDFLYTYQVTPHAMMGVSSFELMFGHKMRTKLDILPLPTCINHDAEVCHHVSTHQSQMKAYCDKKRGACTPTFKVGNKVRVRKQTRSQKTSQIHRSCQNSKASGSLHIQIV